MEKQEHRAHQGSLCTWLGWVMRIQWYLLKGSAWQTVTAQIVGIRDMEKPLTQDDMIWSWGSEKACFEELLSCKTSI